MLEEVERPLIQLTLAATRGNQVRAAEILGLNRNTLRKKIHDLGVEMAARPALRAIRRASERSTHLTLCATTTVEFGAQSA